MLTEPVEGRGWWWVRAVVLALVVGGIATVIALSIQVRGYEKRTGLETDLGTGYELGLRPLLIGAGVTAAVLGMAGILSAVRARWGVNRAGRR